MVIVMVQHRRELYHLRIALLQIVGNLKVVCLLNKVNATTKGLKEKKFPERIIKAVEALRQRPKERYAYYAERAAKNPIAKEIIRTVVYEALNITYLEKIDEDSMKYLNEYLAAWHILNPKGQD